MLTVVDDQQRRSVGGCLTERPHGSTTVDVELRCQSECTDRSVGDLAAVAFGGEVDEPDAAWEPVGARSGDLDGEAGLAAAAHTADGDESVMIDQCTQFVDLVLTSDELGRHHRQVVACLLQRPQRRMIPLVELPQPDGLGQVT